MSITDSGGPGVIPRPGLEFEGFQGRVLRSNQKFTAKGALSGTPTQRFFGGKPREVRIVVFLRDVRQNQVAGPAVEALGIGKKFAHGVIRKVASAGKDALLNDPRVWPNLQHVEIMIRFQNQAIGRSQVELHKFRHVAEVGADGNLGAVGAKSKSDRVGRVVRNGKSVNVDIADRKTLARLNGFDPAQALAKSLGKVVLKLGHGGFGHIQRGFPDAKNLRKAVAMVGVFVGDQDGVKAADFAPGSGQSRERFAFTKPGVNKDAGAFGFEQCEIARTAGRKYRNA